jgi:hypothetical protein
MQHTQVGTIQQRPQARTKKTRNPPSLPFLLSEISASPVNTTPSQSGATSPNMPLQSAEPTRTATPVPDGDFFQPAATASKDVPRPPASGPSYMLPAIPESLNDHLDHSPSIRESITPTSEAAFAMDIDVPDVTSGGPGEGSTREIMAIDSADGIVDSIGIDELDLQDSVNHSGPDPQLSGAHGQSDDDVDAMDYDECNPRGEDPNVTQRLTVSKNRRRPILSPPPSPEPICGRTEAPPPAESALPLAQVNVLSQPNKRRSARDPR